MLMKKPNIIFLIQDQMQQQVVWESSDCRMPNLRNLMADGICFANAHTCNAVCSPSRASLLTGTLPHIHGMIEQIVGTFLFFDDERTHTP